MKRVSKAVAVAEQQKHIRELRVAPPIDVAELALAERHLKWLRNIGKPPTPKRAKLIAAVRGTLETLLTPCIKPGMNPVLWTLAAESAVRICNQQGKALTARYNKPGASRDKGEAMRTAWASGKWPTKDKCAAEHGPKVGLGFVAARRYLRGA